MTLVWQAQKSRQRNQPVLWTDGKRRIPCDLRVYDAPTTGLTKNDRFCQMLINAKQRNMNQNMFSLTAGTAAQTTSRQWQV